MMKPCMGSNDDDNNFFLTQFINLINTHTHTAIVTIGRRGFSLSLVEIDTILIGFPDPHTHINTEREKKIQNPKRS